MSGLFDRYVVDGMVNLLATVSYGIGGWLRGFQTGYLRSYVLFLVLAAVGIWVMLRMVTEQVTVRRAGLRRRTGVQRRCAARVRLTLLRVTRQS